MRHPVSPAARLYAIGGALGFASLVSYTILSVGGASGRERGERARAAWEHRSAERFVEGTAQPAEQGTIPAPGSGTASLLFVSGHETRTRYGSRFVAEQTGGVPFVLQTDDGAYRVEGQIVVFEHGEAVPVGNGSDRVLRPGHRACVQGLATNVEGVQGFRGPISVYRDSCANALRVATAEEANNSTMPWFHGLMAVVGLALIAGGYARSRRPSPLERATPTAAASPGADSVRQEASRPIG